MSKATISCYGRSVAISLSSAALISSLATPSPAQTSPVPLPSPTASTNAPTCTEPVSIPATDAFAHEIDDSRTLAFIEYVKNLDTRDRVAVRKRAAEPLPVSESGDFDRALASDCAFTEIDYRSSRLVYAIARIWSGHDALVIQDAARYAIAALLLGNRISSVTIDETLAVFGTSIGALDAMIAKSATPDVASCDRANRLRASISFEQATPGIKPAAAAGTESLLESIADSLRA